LQYEKHLEVWRLGETSTVDVDLGTKRDGDCLQISRSPRKYLHLRSKSDLYITCSSIGLDPNNNPKSASSSQNQCLWLSYSDINVIHIYKLEIVGKNTAEPKVKIEKIESLPLACGNRPAVVMKFAQSSSNGVEHEAVTVNKSELRLCYLTNKSCLQCLKLVNFESGFVLESSIQCVAQDLLLSDNRVYLMAIKNDLVATVDTDLNLIVWSLKTQQQVCVLPAYQHLVSAMCFHPEKNYLLVAYANRKV
jgi:WD40 repeat protein